MRRVVGTHIIRTPYIEARCTPLREGGWRVDSIRGTTDHPHVGDPYLALERHMDVTATVDGPGDARPENTDVR
jgi:hypothetical protein